LNPLGNASVRTVLTPWLGLRSYVSAGQLGAEMVVNGAEANPLVRQLLHSTSFQHPPASYKLTLPFPVFNSLLSTCHMHLTAIKHRLVVPWVKTHSALPQVLGIGILATVGAISVAGNIANEALKDMDIDL